MSQYFIKNSLIKKSSELNSDYGISHIEGYITAVRYSNGALYFQMRWSRFVEYKLKYNVKYKAEIII